MIYKITLSISGDDFYPLKVLDNISSNFIIVSSFGPEDKKFEDTQDIYGYGSISFWHQKKFSLEENIIEYEKSFVKFLDDNYQQLIASGAKDFELYLEIYYEGDQCNFEIFNKSILKRLSDFDVSIPVSVYQLKEEQMQEWVAEIALEWTP